MLCSLELGLHFAGETLEDKPESEHRDGERPLFRDRQVCRLPKPPGRGGWELGS